MTSKLLELSVLYKQKKRQVINTEMDMFIEWEVEVVKSEKVAQLVINCIKIYGSFAWTDRNDDYKKETKITLKTDESWKTNVMSDSSVLHNFNMIEPETAFIDFDTKKITITF